MRKGFDMDTGDILISASVAGELEGLHDVMTRRIGEQRITRPRRPTGR